MALTIAAAILLGMVWVGIRRPVPKASELTTGEELVIGLSQIQNADLSEAGGGASVLLAATSHSGKLAIWGTSIPLVDAPLWVHDGENSRSIARLGSGPAEVRFPGSAAPVVAGVLVYDASRQRRLSFSHAGDFLGEQDFQVPVSRTAIISSWEDMYWVDVRQGNASFVRLGADGKVNRVQTTLPWRTTLRASRILAIARDTLLGFADLTGCLHMVDFATESYEIIGCLPEGLQDSVRRAAKQFFGPVRPEMPGRPIPDFPIQLFARIGCTSVLIGFPAMPGRPSSFYLMDFKGGRIRRVAFRETSGRSIDLAPVDGVWFEGTSVLSDRKETYAIVGSTDPEIGRTCVS